ncbi:MAG: chlorite dismutase family protein [Anaerolineae bacterium]|nr:chlorite dismutase family protein [Anaerolineae bacterium]
MSERQADDNGRSGKSRQGRQFVKFSFYKLDPAFRRLPEENQRAAKLEFLSAIRSFNRRMLLRSYSLVGLRADADFMIWQVAETPERFQELATAILNTGMGPYLHAPHAYLAVTRRSIYDIGAMDGEDAAAERLVIAPGDHRYLFVYPFVKTRAWYALSMEARQAMIDEHIRIGRRYPQIRLNTTYSYGIDDQEFVVAFEGDNPADFVDLVMELRESKASLYTLRDTPTFTCRHLPLAEMLDSLGGPPIAADVALFEGDADGWIDALSLDALPPGDSAQVYIAGQQVALFNVGGTLYALGNRCSHARGPLVEGRVEGDGDACTVVCPWHYARFDLATGQVVDGVATMPVPTYEVAVRDGVIRVRARQPAVERTL